MQAFFEMLRRVSSSSYHDQMMKSVQPLKEHLGINHFWYYQVSETGYYTYLGTHSDWSEYCFEHHLIHHFPCLRHPKKLKMGVELMKNSTSETFKTLLKEAWEKFRINFNVNLLSRTAGGVEAFGFATESNHPKMDELILKELPLLQRFTMHFRAKHQKLFQLVYDNQVNFASYLGKKFFEGESERHLAQDRETLLKKLGLSPFFPLTLREKEILGFLASGFSAPYIGHHLELATKTVQNYIENIKGKLDASKRSELIQKAKELVEIGYCEIE